MTPNGHKPHLRGRQAEAYPKAIKIEWGTMAQVIESRFVLDGRYRIQSIKAVGRHRARIIEIEDVDRRQRIHGTASALDRLVLRLLGQAYENRGATPKRGAD